MEGFWDSLLFLITIFFKDPGTKTKYQKIMKYAAILCYVGPRALLVRSGAQLIQRSSGVTFAGYPESQFRALVGEKWLTTWVDGLESIGPALVASKNTASDFAAPPLRRIMSGDVPHDA